MQELLTGRIRLFRPSAQVLSFPSKDSASVAKVSHNTQINEAVVISRCCPPDLDRRSFHSGVSVARSFSYLLHRHVEHEAAGFMKKAAGPYNPRHEIRRCREDRTSKPIRPRSLHGKERRIRCG